MPRDKNWKIIPNTYGVYRVNQDARVERQLSNGKWKRVMPYMGVRHKVAYVHLLVAPCKRRAFKLVNIMDELFFDNYGTKNNLCKTHRNGMALDCAVENIQFITRSELAKLHNKKNSSKRVAKVDARGNILAYYPSCKVAASKNFISTTAVYNRVHNLVKDPYELDGYTYQFVDMD